MRDGPDVCVDTWVLLRRAALACGRGGPTAYNLCYASTGRAHIFPFHHWLCRTDRLLLGSALDGDAVARIAQGRFKRDART